MDFSLTTLYFDILIISTFLGKEISDQEVNSKLKELLQYSQTTTANKNMYPVKLP